MPDPIEIPPSDSPDDTAGKFKHNAEVIILLFGRADDTRSAEVRSAFARALIPIAILSNALFVDDGAANGLAGLLGDAIDQVDLAPATLGILSPGTTAPAANHAALMRLPAQCANPGKARFLIAAGLAGKPPSARKLTIALLIGGSDSDKAIALRCARNCWPLLVMRNTGVLGDALLTAKDSVDAGGKLAEIADPDVREIVDSGMMRAIDFSADTDTLKRLLLGPIQKPGEILADAWSRYDELDKGAVKKQTWFRTTQIAILLLTVLATLMAILFSVIHGLDPHKYSWAQSAEGTLHIVMIVIPISISLLVGFNARFRDGNKWILLRAASESVKQHIFRYRTRSGAYSEDQCKTQSASTQLASNIRDITSNLGQSEVNRTNLAPQPIGDPQRTTFLTAEEYLRTRVDDQIAYFVKTTRRLYRQLMILQICILSAGGAGTFLAAIKLDLWVAFTTALATAFASKLELDQVETSLVQYNAALMSLRNIESWWKGLSPWERTRQKNIDLLVDQTETTLEHETAGWVQKMQSTLEKLTEKESSTSQKSDQEPDQKSDQNSNQKSGQTSDQKPSQNPNPNADQKLEQSPDQEPGGNGGS
ncbi:DUF4231 domain-containing protein [Acidicapsa acidisoli]|uniref:DUF4231 domain-containing protein n=1 Tax=Acidicapsa acidisoli TaxID=1615681 RepID=UPI0021E0B5EA|nr:DUF4231 domain-containing protein [Acidicapsa acidisoli]